MTGLEVLVQARDLISDPAHWTQGVFARDIEGKQCEVVSEYATCFCALGALDRVSVKRARARASASSFLYAALDSGDIRAPSIVSVNDELGHGATLKIFDRAIEIAKEAKK